MKSISRIPIMFLCLIIIIFLFPWKIINWGTISILPAATITVTGEAESQVASQVAKFTAGFSQVNDDKDLAVKEVNLAVSEIIDQVKAFGIKETDIKTQNINIYRMEEQSNVDGRQLTKQGQWRVSNDVEITLRDIGRTSELADILSQSPATNIYGPNFSLDNTDNSEVELFQKAIENAKLKAKEIAKSTNRKLGKVISITEGDSHNNPLYKFAGEGLGGSGGIPIEPGSQAVSQTVTVIFELK